MPARLIPLTDLQRLLAEVDLHALTTIVARVAGVPTVTTWTWEESDPITGCAGYVVPKAGIRVHWQASNGRRGQSELICKWFRGWHGHGEAAVYTRLEAVSAPVPHCYGSLRDPHGDEILVLDRLPRIGFDVRRLNDRMTVARSLGAIHRLDWRPWPSAGYPHLRMAPAAQEHRHRALTRVSQSRL